MYARRYTILYLSAAKTSRVAGKQPAKQYSHVFSEAYQYDATCICVLCLYVHFYLLCYLDSFEEKNLYFVYISKFIWHICKLYSFISFHQYMHTSFCTNVNTRTPLDTIVFITSLKYSKNTILNSTFISTQLLQLTLLFGQCQIHSLIVKLQTRSKVFIQLATKTCQERMSQFFL